MIIRNLTASNTVQNIEVPGKNELLQVYIENLHGTESMRIKTESDDLSNDYKLIKAGKSFAFQLGLGESKVYFQRHASVDVPFEIVYSADSL